MSVHSEVLAANDEYAANFGAKSDLPLPLARRFAIPTCMDARLDPAKYAGLTEGDAHVIRNAGGRASDDAINRWAALVTRVAANARDDQARSMEARRFEKCGQ